MGWQITTATRRLARAIAAATAGTLTEHKKGEWHICVPGSLPVVITTADTSTLWCRLSTEPDLGIMSLTIAPWPAAKVLSGPVASLPASGLLSVRDLRLTTRMGRTVRYLIAVFTAT